MPPAIASCSSITPPVASSVLRYILAFCVLPNVVYFAVTSAHPNEVGWIGLGYLIVGLVAVRFSRRVGALLAALMMLVDLLAYVASVYYFTWSDVLLSLRSLTYVPFPRIIAYGGAVLLVATSVGIGCFLLIRKAETPQAARRMFSACCLIVFVLVALQNLLGDESADRDAVSFPGRGDGGILRAASLQLPFQVVELWRVYHRPVSVRVVPSATAPALQSVSIASEKPHIVQILVESLGIPEQQGMLEYLESPYTSAAISSRYYVRTGQVAFKGGTVDGETRELCHNTLGLAVTEASANQTLHCLPRDLHSMGYRSMGLHGYTGRMFDRARWYPLMGFDQSYFYEDFRRAGLPDCAGAFVGTCDHSIAEWIGDTLTRAKDPMFVHWVTLGSHLPVPERLDEHIYNADCKAAGASDSTPLCSWVRLQFELHTSVAALAARPELPDTIFVIVGDHAPPFLDRNLRSRFSSRQVPFLALIPKHLEPEHRTVLRAGLGYSSGVTRETSSASEGKR